MACKTCGKGNFNTFFNTCKVCELLDSDTSPKWVKYCDDCKAYICKPCSGDWIRRGRAFIKNILT